MAGGNTIEEFTLIKRKPRPLKFYLDTLKRGAPSLMGFGIFAGSMFLYFTDWQIFMDKVPFYRKKFEPKDSLI